MEVVIAEWINSDESEVKAELKRERHQSLYIKVLPFNRMPEMYTEDGHQIILAYDIEPIIKDGHISIKVPDNSVFSLVKLPKGSTITNNGQITMPYDRRGPSMEAVKNGDYSQKAKQILTLNPYDYIPQDRDLRTDLLDIAFTVFLDVGNFYDHYSIMQDYIKTGTPNPNRIIGGMHPVLGLIVIAADMNATRMTNEMNETHATFNRDDLEKAKKEGIDEVNHCVTRSQNGNMKNGKRPVFLDKGGMEYEILKVTESTVKKILEGEFKTYERMENFNYESSTNEAAKISMLYMKIGGGDYDEDTYIIETFFY